eukprot:scaffold82593_cov16-Tisochrysis_lutea.AAC.1
MVCKAFIRIRSRPQFGMRSVRAGSCMIPCAKICHSCLPCFPSADPCCFGAHPHSASAAERRTLQVLYPVPRIDLLPLHLGNSWSSARATQTEQMLMKCWTNGLRRSVRMQDC